MKTFLSEYGLALFGMTCMIFLIVIASPVSGTIGDAVNKSVNAYVDKTAGDDDSSMLGTAGTVIDSSISGMYSAAPPESKEKNIVLTPDDRVSEEIDVSDYTIMTVSVSNVSPGTVNLAKYSTGQPIIQTITNNDNNVYDVSNFSTVKFVGLSGGSYEAHVSYALYTNEEYKHATSISGLNTSYSTRVGENPELPTSVTIQYGFGSPSEEIAEIEWEDYSSMITTKGTYTLHYSYPYYINNTATTKNGSVTLNVQQVNTWAVTSNGTYRFVQSGSKWTSNNGGHDESTARTVWNITTSSNYSGSIRYYVSSEEDCDEFTLTLRNKSTNGVTTLVSRTSGSVSERGVNINLQAGVEYELTARYEKDDGGNGGQDKAYVILPSIS